MLLKTFEERTMGLLRMQDVTLSGESVFGLPMHRWKNEDHGDDSEMQHLPAHPGLLKVRQIHSS